MDGSELERRRALSEDAARPDAVARRHASGGRTARENIADLVDVVVADEAEAVAVAKRLLGYFQGAVAGTAPDQTRLRTLVPERARRAYNVAPIIETLADEGSVTFVRRRFAKEMVTRWRGSAGARSVSSPTTRGTWPAPSPRRRQTRPPDSSNCAMRSTSR